MLALGGLYIKNLNSEGMVVNAEFDKKKLKCRFQCLEGVNGRLSEM